MPIKYKYVLRREIPKHVMFGGHERYFQYNNFRLHQLLTEDCQRQTPKTFEDLLLTTQEAIKQAVQARYSDIDISRIKEYLWWDPEKHSHIVVLVNVDILNYNPVGLETRVCYEPGFFNQEDETLWRLVMS